MADVTIERLENALRKAHEAGDTETAKRFANEIRALQASSTAAPTPDATPRLNIPAVNAAVPSGAEPSMPGAVNPPGSVPAGTPTTPEPRSVDAMIQSVMDLSRRAGNSITLGLNDRLVRPALGIPAEEAIAETAAAEKRTEGGAGVGMEILPWIFAPTRAGQATGGVLGQALVGANEAGTIAGATEYIKSGDPLSAAKDYFTTLGLGTGVGTIAGSLLSRFGVDEIPEQLPKATRGQYAVAARAEKAKDFQHSMDLALRDKQSSRTNLEAARRQKVDSVLKKAERDRDELKYADPYEVVESGGRYAPKYTDEEMKAMRDFIAGTNARNALDLISNKKIMEANWPGVAALAAGSLGAATLGVVPTAMLGAGALTGRGVSRLVLDRLSNKELEGITDMMIKGGKSTPKQVVPDKELRDEGVKALLRSLGIGAD